MPYLERNIGLPEIGRGRIQRKLALQEKLRQMQGITPKKKYNIKDIGYNPYSHWEMSPEEKEEWRKKLRLGTTPELEKIGQGYIKPEFPKKGELQKIAEDVLRRRHEMAFRGIEEAEKLGQGGKARGVLQRYPGGEIVETQPGLQVERSVPIEIIRGTKSTYQDPLSGEEFPTYAEAAKSVAIEEPIRSVLKKAGYSPKQIAKIMALHRLAGEKGIEMAVERYQPSEKKYKIGHIRRYERKKGWLGEEEPTEYQVPVRVETTTGEVSPLFEYPGREFIGKTKAKKRWTIKEAKTLREKAWDLIGTGRAETVEEAIRMLRGY